MTCGFRDSDGFRVSYAMPGRARVLADAVAVQLPEPSREERIIETLAEVLHLVKDEPEEPSAWDPEQGPEVPEPHASEPAADLTREQRRSRRKREVRARTVSVKRMTKRELEFGRLLYPETDYWKPSFRAECSEGPRPCPFVSCRHHLFLDVSPRTGAIKLNFPDLEVWELEESCALDVADRGGTTLEDVGTIVNLTRERIRQVEVKALSRVQQRGGALLEQLRAGDEGPLRKRRLPVLTEDDS